MEEGSMMAGNRSITFFDTQFQKQVAGSDYALNPFETVALPFVRGRTLDFGCGLGNLGLEAARRGARVTAVDGSPTAIERIRQAGLAEKLDIEPVLADIAGYRIERDYDTIVAIGLLMFFRPPKALELLADIQQHVAPGGVAIVNVLIEGTTFMGMFDGDNYHLFEPAGLSARFNGWTILLDQRHSFEAPGGTRKEFSTLIARND
jgi:tellurite methyltransferase